MQRLRCALLVLSMGLVACQEPSIPAAPHPIILIDIDTLRADHLGSYGYERATSPALDRFAAESIRFDWAFSQAPYTPPSQTSILTSLYPRTHGVGSIKERLAEEVTTLAEVFAAAGYRTAAFTDGGFMSRSFGLGQGFEHFDEEGGGLAVVGPKVARWLDEHADERFLLLFHTYEVHTPYAPPAAYRDLFLTGLAPPTPGFEPTTEQMETVRHTQWTTEAPPLPPADLAYAKALYDAEIRYLDDWFAGFYDQLAAHGLLERATVVIFSDHGEEFGEHGSVLHEKLYPTVTRIPLMIRLPGGQWVREVQELVESIDLMPTLLDLTGLETPAAAQGRSLVPLFRGLSRGRALAFGESPYFADKPFVAWDDHQLLLNAKTGVPELYAFRTDPRARDDRAAAEPAIAARLGRALAGWQAAMKKRGRLTPDNSELDQQTLEQLRALGYIR